MIVPFAQRPAAANDQLAPMPSQAQLLMAAADMHGKGLLGAQPEPETPDTKTLFQKLDENKPKPKRGHR